MLTGHGRSYLPGLKKASNVCLRRHKLTGTSPGIDTEPFNRPRGCEGLSCPRSARESEVSQSPTEVLTRPFCCGAAAVRHLVCAGACVRVCVGECVSVFLYLFMCVSLCEIHVVKVRQ